MKKNILLRVAYDGTYFHGSQFQPELRTVEGVLKEAIEEVVQEEITLYAAGRTDQGVHALGQGMNFRCHLKIDIGNLPRVLNAHLPDDLSIIGSQFVPMDFHSRYFAREKHYRYIIYNHRYRNALYHNRALHVPFKLDVNRMERSIMPLIGDHDFAAFVGRHSDPEQTVRTLNNIEFRQRGNLIIIDFYGQSFLKNMIRIIVGTAIEIGRGLRDEEDLYRATITRDRRTLGAMCKACGLYLMNIDFNWEHHF